MKDGRTIRSSYPTLRVAVYCRPPLRDLFFFFKQKTAYEIVSGDWSSDVCSSDLMIWRPPMLHSVITQFLRSVEWGELDYLIIDLPPGTGDVQLTLIQTVAVTGAVVVTTPSTVALADVRKAIEMFRQVNVEVLGVVENMSTFACPHCGKAIDIFGHGEGAKTAIAYGVPVLGEIEIDPRIRVGGDTGKPVAALGEEGAGAKSLYQVARAVAKRLEEVAATSSGPSFQID